VRILVAVEPRMYREVIALSLHQHRPDAEGTDPPAFVPQLTQQSIPPTLGRASVRGTLRGATRFCFGSEDA
jgi:hypothetical protein